MADKILFIRFSSIGDIVLTSPVVRAVRRQRPDAEIHFVTKEVFRPILSHNPYIDKLHTFHYAIEEVAALLKAEKFDIVIDLHKNIRSYLLKRKVGARNYSFNKLNLEKFLAVNLKLVHLLPEKHIVDRYFEGLTHLKIANDGAGLDYFIPPEDEVNVPSVLFKNKPTRFIALVIGGSYYTKKIPVNKLFDIVRTAILPVVILGGKADKPVADELRKTFPHLVNGSGQFNINQSASVIRQAEWVITSDTGMMHIAAAFGKKIISAWGNTIPRFGMYPYKPRPENRILEVNGLKCRPCSKLGYGRCPLGHFRCMQDIDYTFVKELE